MFRTRHAEVAVTLLSCAVLTACGSAPGWEGRITSEEGVIQVYNPEVPLQAGEGPFLVEREVLGGPDAPEEQILTAPFAVVVVADGTRLVLDEREARIHRYDADGTWLGSFGRKGDGPGEFQDPSDMTLLPDGNIAVVDYERIRLSYFTPTGDFIDSRNLETGVGQVKALESGALVVTSQPRVMRASISLNAGPDEEPTLFEVLDRSGEKVGGFGRIREYEGLMLGMWMNRAYPAIAPGDSVIVNYLGLPRIEVYAPDGGLARVIHRNQPWEPIEPVEESSVSEEGYVRMSFRFDLLSTGMAVSPDGRLWAVALAVNEPDRREFASEEERQAEEIPQRWGIDLYDATGRWLARQELGADYPAPFLDWWGDGLYLLNPEGDATIRRYQVTARD